MFVCVCVLQEAQRKAKQERLAAQGKGPPKLTSDGGGGGSRYIHTFYKSLFPNDKELKTLLIFKFFSVTCLIV